MRSILSFLILSISIFLFSCSNTYLGAVLYSSYPDDYFYGFITDYNSFELVLDKLYDFSDEKYFNSADRKEFLKLKSSVTEETFVNNNIYMESFEVGSGSYRYKISEVVEVGNKATINIKPVGEYEYVTDDMARHFIYAIVSKNINQVDFSMRQVKEASLNFLVNVCSFDIEEPLVVKSYTDLLAVFSNYIPIALLKYDQDYFISNDLVFLSLVSSGAQIITPKKVFLPNEYDFTDTVAICFDLASDQPYDANVVMNYFIFEISEKLIQNNYEIKVTDWTVYYSQVK